MPHLLRQDYDGLSFRDAGLIAFHPGRLHAEPSCWSKLSQFRAEFPTYTTNDTERPASVPCCCPLCLSRRKCVGHHPSLLRIASTDPLLAWGNQAARCLIARLLVRGFCLTTTAFIGTYPSPVRGLSVRLLLAPEKRTSQQQFLTASLAWYTLLLQLQVHSLYATWRKRMFEGPETYSKSSGPWSRESPPLRAPALKLVFIYCCLCRSGLRELMWAIWSRWGTASTSVFDCNKPKYSSIR